MAAYMPDISVGSYASLSSAVANAPDGELYVIEINSNISDYSAVIVIPTDKQIVLINDGTPRTLTTQGNYRHFSVIGALTLTDGVTLTHYNTSNGGGVAVSGSGIFCMEGGTISGIYNPVV